MKSPINGMCLLFACVVTATGCSEKVASSSIASAQQALEQARDMVAGDNAAGALPLLSQAIGEGGLDADQYAEAFLLRAQCYALGGDVEKAQADLEQAELGAPSQGLLHLTRGIILSQQGKESEARKEFAAAKRLDSSLVIPK